MPRRPALLPNPQHANVTVPLVNWRPSAKRTSMTLDETQLPDDGRRKASRRDFLQRAAASGLTVAACAHAQQKSASNRPVLAYVGTYSSPQGPEGSRGRGEGIRSEERRVGSGCR